MKVKQFEKVYEKLTNLDTEEDMIIKYLTPEISPNFLNKLVNVMIRESGLKFTSTGNGIEFSW